MICRPRRYFDGRFSSSREQPGFCERPGTMTGYPTLKIFTTNILPSRTGRMIDFGDIWEAFQVLAKEGGLGVIHAEDNDIVMHMYAKLIRENRVSFEKSPRSTISFRRT